MLVALYCWKSGTYEGAMSLDGKTRVVEEHVRKWPVVSPEKKRKMEGYDQDGS
jgi:hypothetical protein